MSAETKDYLETKIIDLRRRIRPAGMIAELADGKRVNIKLGGQKGRWSRVRRFLELHSEWTKIDCYADPGCEEWIDAIKNDEADDLPDEPEPEASGADPLAVNDRLFRSCSRHIHDMMGLVTKANAERERQQAEFIETLLSRNNQLETIAAEALDMTRNAALQIQESAAQQGRPLDPKEQAMLGMLDAVSRKFGFGNLGLLESFQQGQAPRKLPGGSGNGTAATVGGGDPI